MTQSCVSCGRALAELDRFCSNCGTPVQPDPQAAQSQGPTTDHADGPGARIGPNVGSWREEAASGPPTPESSSSRSRQATSISGRVWILLIGLAIAGGSCVWNVNVADREGEYPMLGLLLLVVGSAMVLGVAGMWNEEAKAEQASRELTAATGHFSSPTIIRSYENSDAGLRQANTDAATLARQGYVPTGQAADGGHINLGRTATGAVLTGGISLLFGGSRTKGKVTITYIKSPT